MKGEIDQFSGNCTLQKQGLLEGSSSQKQHFMLAKHISRHSKRAIATVVDPGGVRGVQMHPPFEGLPSRVLSTSVQRNYVHYGPH